MPRPVTTLPPLASVCGPSAARGEITQHVCSRAAPVSQRRACELPPLLSAARSCPRPHLYSFHEQMTVRLPVLLGRGCWAVGSSRRL